jgi:hypothetical protein
MNPRIIAMLLIALFNINIRLVLHLKRWLNRRKLFILKSVFHKLFLSVCCPSKNDLSLLPDTEILQILVSEFEFVINV